MNKDTRQQTKIAPQAFSAANLRDASIGRRSSQGRNGANIYCEASKISVTDKEHLTKGGDKVHYSSPSMGDP